MIDKIMVRPAIAGFLLHEWINFKALQVELGLLPDKSFVSGRGYFNYMYLDQFKKK